ncbi:MAG: 16S rRNA (guanine(527)-N(7))-methyltransferase RsmG [Phycisphaerales bacterium]|nr:MAG: 16S rRNA (guanine(527)-N(7))-methyltransferase RsmG [Phycisphaerales bacterium]
MTESLEQFNGAIIEAFGRMAAFPSSAQLEQLRAHFRAVVDTNAKFNLTRITDPAEAAVKHYADSLALLMWVKKCDIEVESVLDMGTGAGFPAVPLAVMRPDWVVTAIDATRKKVDFVARVAAETSLSNLHAVHAHSRHWRPGRKSQIVLAKAVGRLDACLVQGARHVSPDGWIVVYKTAAMNAEEFSEAASTASKLGLRISEPFPYTLEYAGEDINRILQVCQPAP